MAYFQGDCGLFSSVKEIFPEPHQVYSLKQYDVFISHNSLAWAQPYMTSNGFGPAFFGFPFHIQTCDVGYCSIWPKQFLDILDIS